MKIAIAARDLGSLSGVGILARELALGLSRAGHETILLAGRCRPRPGTPNGNGPGMEPRADRDGTIGAIGRGGARGAGGLCLERVGMLPFPSIARAWSFDQSSQRRARRLRADILHGHGDLTAQDILTVNNVDAAEAHHTGRERVGSAGTLFVRRRQFDLTKVRRIVAVSERARRDIETFYGAPRNRVEVVYWGIDSARFNPEGRLQARARLRRRLGLEPGMRIFLSLISGDPERRNVRGLLDAFARSRLGPQEVLLVVGDSGAASYPEARELLGEGRLKLLAKTPEPEEIYRGCDFFILPAHYETFGMTALEAMATGLPCAVTALCGISELVEDGRNGLVIADSRDTLSLAAALDRLAMNPALAARLQAGGLELARRMTLAKTVRDYTNLYEEALREKLGAGEVAAR